MVCNNCGNQVQDGQSFCSACGAQVASAMQTDNQNTYRQPQNVQQQQNGQQPKQDTYVPSGHGKSLGMGWFNFIIWFQLFAAAVLNFITGITTFTGKHYDEPGYGNLSGAVYSMYENLELYDKLYGIVAIVLAVMSIFVRFRLSGFKKNGPMLYFILLGANMVVPFIYACFASQELGVSVADLLEGPSLGISAVMLAINIVYFNNRKERFVN